MKKIICLLMVVFCLSMIGCKNGLREVEEYNSNITNTINNTTDTPVPTVENITNTPIPTVKKTEEPIETQEPIEDAITANIDYSYNSQVKESEQVIFYADYIFLIFEDVLYRFDRNTNEKHKIDDTAERYLSLSDDKLFYIKEDGIYKFDFSSNKKTRVIRVENVYEILVSESDIYYTVLNHVESDDYSSTLYKYNIDTKQKVVISDYVYEYLSLYRGDLYFTEGESGYTNELVSYSNGELIRRDIYVDGYMIYEDEIYYVTEGVEGVTVYNLVTGEKRIEDNVSIEMFYNYFVIEVDERIEEDLWNMELYLLDSKNYKKYHLTDFEYTFSVYSSLTIKVYQESLYLIERNWNEGYNIYKISIGKNKVNVNTIMEFNDFEYH